MVGCKLVPLIALATGQDDFLGRDLAANNNFHLTTPGSFECDFGQPVPEKNCNLRVKNLALQQNATLGRKWLLKGSGGTCLDGAWGEVPGGCSVQVQSAGNWIQHFKSGPPTEVGCVSPLFQLVCTRPQTTTPTTTTTTPTTTTTTPTTTTTTPTTTTTTPTTTTTTPTTTTTTPTTTTTTPTTTTTTPTTTTTTPTPPTTPLPFSCDLNQAVGVGKARRPKWGWRSDWGVCTKFFWGGALPGSNANRFETKADCTSAASQCPYTRLPGCLGVPPTPVDNRCNQPDGKAIYKGPRAVGGCQRCTCQDGQLQCNAVPRYRKEIVDMTQPEFDKFAEGINILKESGDWVEIAWMHDAVSGDPNNPMVSHGNNRFLHWHRKYLFDLESLIQAAVNSCDVTIPYWNWALDPGMAGTDQMAVWGKDRYGALKYDDSTAGPASPQTWKIFAPFFCPTPPEGQPSSCCFAQTCGAPAGPCDPEGNCIPGAPCGTDGNCLVLTENCCERGEDGEPLSQECWCNTEATAPALWDGVIVLGRNPNGPRADSVTDGKFGAGSAFHEDPIIRGWSGGPITTVSFATMQADLELRATVGPSSGSNKDVATEFVINQTQRDAIAMQQQEIFENFVPSFPGEQPEFLPSTPYSGTSGLVEMLENFFHNSMHCAVGGIMCGPLSPYDPIFFLHHAQVDKIWKDWQDQHLDVESEREWARNESWAQMEVHICPQTAQNGLVNAADVEDSMDMTGTQDGSVYYYQRQQDFQCGDDEEYPEQWNAIQTCMETISKAQKWHEIQRVVAGPDDVSDMCSANNPSNFKAFKMWLEAMVEAGHMTKKEKKLQLNLHRTDLEGGFGDRETKYEDYTQLTRCEKKLCMAVTSGEKSIRSVCKDLQQEEFQCNQEDLKKRIKCRTDNWTWNKINPENVLCDSE